MASNSVEDFGGVDHGVQTVDRFDELLLDVALEENCRGTTEEDGWDFVHK